MVYPLKSTKFKHFKKRIFGFDIETCDDNKTFLMASIVGFDRYNNKYEKVFYSKDEIINELKTNLIFRNSYIFATNLSFDFFGTFFDTDEAQNFHTGLRGSNLLFAKTYYNGNEFCYDNKKAYSSGQRKSSLTFVDSMNYCQMSVKQMGKVINLPKLELTTFKIGNKPETKEQWKELETYNLRDSEITLNFMKFFIDKVEELGATFKLTIASTSMSLFKNKYFKGIVFGNKKEVLRDLFKAYYGGRTEVFQRGTFTNANYYDFNSLYPSVMESFEYPNPNSQRISKDNTTKFIMSYEGVSEVTINIPYMKIPLLPIRVEGKLIFPYGDNIKGSWTNIELRKAIDLGATITKVHKSIYYFETCRPFKEFVTDLYTLRNKYKAENNPMQLVVKLLMNSLYGKFGEKFDDKGIHIHQNSITKEQLQMCGDVEKVGDYYLLKESREPKSHCIPIWAIYVTAYGRIKIFDTLIQHTPIYCDTDSIITTDTLPTSNNLGDLKLEMEVAEGICVRPKFYILKPKDENWSEAKLKGLSKRLTHESFIDLINNPTIAFDKFAKFKESIRRGFTPNELIPTSKTFGLEDEKRNWGRRFSLFELQDSQPLKVEGNIIVDNQLLPNLIANKSPIINNGANSNGEVAPIIKYDNISIIEPNTPITDEL